MYGSKLCETLRKQKDSGIFCLFALSLINHQMNSERIEIPHDILWKSLLEDIFPEFLRYFIPESDTLFDFSMGVTFLDKELEQLFPEGDTPNRRADKLAKVYLKDGTEQWILVHVEVQGYEDKVFGDRMFNKMPPKSVLIYYHPTYP